MSEITEQSDTDWELAHGRIASAHNSISTAIHHLDAQAARVYDRPEAVELLATWMRRLSEIREPLAEYLDQVTPQPTATTHQPALGKGVDA